MTRFMRCLTVCGALWMPMSGKVAYADAPMQGGSATAPQGTADSGQLEEIVVTAAKTTESLQQAAAAITVATGETLRDFGITDLQGLNSLIPSSRFEPITAFSNLYIRGIGSEQDRVFVDQLVSETVNGIYVPRYANSLGMFDVHDAEVLPGPQGTLYGAGAVGGVIAVTYNQPTREYLSSSSVEFGDYSTVHATLVENLPLSDTVSIRAAADYSKHSAYETGGSDTGNTFGGRVSMLAKPSDNLSAYIWGSYWRDTGGPADGVVVTGNGPKFANPSNPWDPVACSDSPCSFIPKQNIGPNSGNTGISVVGGQFDWQLQGATLSLIPGYLDVHSDVISYIGPLLEHFQETQRQYSSELRLTGDADEALRWITGLYYWKTNDFQDFAIGGPSNPVVRNYERTYAAYGQLTWAVLDPLRLIGGLRISSQQKEDDYIVPALDPASHTWHPFNWKVGVEADVDTHSMLYATVQTGFANGTFDSTNPTEGGKPAYINPTKLISYTAGSKNLLLGGRLELNDELFYYDYDDYLLQTIFIHDNGTTSNGFYTVPKFRDYGNQLDVRIRAPAQIELQGGVAYLHARTGTFNTGVATYSNYELFESPPWTLTVGAQKSCNLAWGASLVARVNTHFENGYWGNFPQENGTRQGAFTKTDATLTYYSADAHWSIGLWGKNLENKAQLGPTGYVGAGVTQGVAYITPPRTFGIRFTAQLGAQ